MRRIYKVTFIIIAVILALMIVTNPSYNAFKERTQSFEVIPKGIYQKTYQVSRERLVNGFVYSIYLVEATGIKTEYEEPYQNSKKYVGIFGNFFEFK